MKIIFLIITTFSSYNNISFKEQISKGNTALPLEEVIAIKKTPS